LKILATYCSKEKNESEELLPAHKRYQSKRIERLNAIASEKRMPFYILSGKFGLIKADHPIAYYDHLLIDSEVASHAKFVASQIIDNDITEIEFLSRTIEEDPQLASYHKCIQMTAEIANIHINIIHGTFQE
jgi:hypothetical protein